MRFGVFLAMMGLAAALAMPWPAAAQRAGEGVAPKGSLNTLIDIRDAIRGCWKWPPLSEVRQGMELTIRLSFKRSGEIFGARLTYETPNVSDDERRMYYGVLMDALKRCSPLPVSESLGAAIAGRPFTFRFNDNRTERKA
jgi:hypothetical protein